MTQTTMPATGAAARAAGTQKYFTGIPCVKGHVAARYAYNGACLACQRDAQAVFRQSPKGRKTHRAYYEKRRSEKPETIMYQTAKARAAKLGVPFDIKPQDIRNVWPVDGRCPVLDIPLEHSFGDAGDAGGHTNNSPSLDKIVPNAGYVAGNIVVMSFLANRLKQDQTDPAVFRRIADWLESNCSKTIQ